MEDPFRRARRAMLIGGAAVLATLGVVWLTVSATPEEAEQIGPLNAAVATTAAGLTLVGALVSGLRQAVSARRHKVVASVRSMAAARPPAPGDATRVVVAVEGATLGHRPSCPLVRGKPVEPARRERALVGSCAMCDA